jgi:ABC-type antimicrobial peptide transport system permease subunit
MVEKRKSALLWWIPVTLGAALVIWQRGENLVFPGLLALGMMPRVVGIGGWSLVGLGFLAVALVALLGPRSRVSKPSLRPYRPPALFSMDFFRHRKKH